MMSASVSPPEMIIASDAWLRTLMKLLNVGNASGDRTEKATIISASPMIVA